MAIMIMVDGIMIPSPYKYEWQLHSVSDADAGRTQDALMHVNYVDRKRELTLAWHYKEWTEVSQIMQAFDTYPGKEYLQVSYPDMLSGRQETRTFYKSDPKITTKFWWSAPMQRYLMEDITFNLIER